MVFNPEEPLPSVNASEFRAAPCNGIKEALGPHSSLSVVCWGTWLVVALDSREGGGSDLRKFQ